MPFSQVPSGIFGGWNLPAPYELLANYVGPPSIHLYRNGTADLTIANTLVEGLANVMLSILHQKGASLNGAPALGSVFGVQMSVLALVYIGFG